MLAALVASSPQLKFVVHLIGRMEAVQPTEQSACPGGQPSTLYEPRSEAVPIAVDWRDLIDSDAMLCRRPWEHARLTPERCYQSIGCPL